MYKIWLLKSKNDSSATNAFTSLNFLKSLGCGIKAFVTIYGAPS